MSVEELVAISRFYGSDPDYVIAGGGNTSFKDGSTLYIKGSGTTLADIGVDGFVRMDREALGKIWKKTYPRNTEERESAVLADMMAARKNGEEGKRPSVETLLHDMLPFAYVVHTHPAVVNGLTCSQGGAEAAAELFGGEALWIESTNPGYILSLAVKNAMEEYTARKGRPASIILLQNHGVFVGADTPGGIREHYRRIMETVKSKIGADPDFSGEVSSWGFSGEITGTFPRDLAETLRFRRNNAIAALVKDRASFYPVSSAFTPDHIVYAGSDPLFVETGLESPASAMDALRTAWEKQYKQTGRKPKILALRGMGIFGAGSSEKAVSLALALFTDAIRVAAYAAFFGGPRFMSPGQIDFINNWEVERYRAQRADASPEKS
jgi:rhamnose utilization protein RhaD (predicted bifunctional aldolase and dehydrogenase)